MKKDISMDFFNQTNENILNKLFNNASTFKLIILWGEKGNGKTFTAYSALQTNHIKTKDIIFSEENILPLNLSENLSLPINDEDAVLIQCSQLFHENYCLFFQNMEFCDLDSQRILYRLLKYHKNNDQKAFIILEYNVLKEPDDILCSLSRDSLFIGNPSKDCFYEYYAAHFDFTPETKDLFERILQITHGNIHNFLTTLKILQYMGIIYKNDNGFIYNNNSTYKIPASLFELYIDLFDELKD